MHHLRLSLMAPKNLCTVLSPWPIAVLSLACMLEPALAFLDSQLNLSENSHEMKERAKAKAITHAQSLTREARAHG
ncbi:hypothetical protein F5148DRAFT_1257009 [Russula earlei]|uniref:Uncharacterized protein n=1 Tax=Russula earlei TaxID=71964 RepID=A0ACC0TTP8_9AGAM|nr:hypothetical protein F5148DRAFT_1257009 [Russula earlei]